MLSITSPALMYYDPCPRSTHARALTGQNQAISSLNLYGLSLSHDKADSEV